MDLFEKFSFQWSLPRLIYLTHENREHDELLLSYFPDIVPIRLKFCIRSLGPFLAKNQLAYLGKSVFILTQTTDLMHKMQVIQFFFSEIHISHKRPSQKTLVSYIFVENEKNHCLFFPQQNWKVRNPNIRNIKLITSLNS